MQVDLVSDQLTVLIDDLGAELKSVKNKNGLEYIWQGDKEIWARHAPVLFPIVGKLKDNTYTFRDKNYKLGQHGFARDKAFTLIEKSKAHCIFELLPDEETRKMYPFEFNFRTIYHLEGNKLSVSHRVKNLSQQPMLFSVGAHPGFNCPLLPTESFEDYFLEFETSSFFQTLLSEGLRAGQAPLRLQENKLFLSVQLFDHDALVFENNQINRIRLKSSVSAHQVSLVGEGWPYFGIWSKKGSSNFVCLEPWYGIADDVNTNHELQQKKGMITLAGEEEFACSYSITLD